MDGRAGLIGAGTTHHRLGRLQRVYDRTMRATCDGAGSPPRISTQRLRWRAGRRPINTRTTESALTRKLEKI